MDNQSKALCFVLNIPYLITWCIDSQLCRLATIIAETLGALPRSYAFCFKEAANHLVNGQGLFRFDYFSVCPWGGGGVVQAVRIADREISFTSPTGLYRIYQ